MAGSILSLLAQPGKTNIAGSFLAGQKAGREAKAFQQKQAQTQQLQDAMVSGDRPAVRDAIARYSAIDPEKAKIVQEIRKGSTEIDEQDFLKTIAVVATMEDDTEKHTVLTNLVARMKRGSTYRRSAEELSKLKGTELDKQLFKGMHLFQNVGLMKSQESTAQKDRALDIKQQAEDTAEIKAEKKTAVTLTKEEKNFLRAHKSPSFAKFLKESRTNTSTTDMSAYVQYAKDEYKRAHNGQEMPPGLARVAMLEFKRMQSKEAGEVATAQQQAKADFASLIAENTKTGTMLAEIANTPALLEAQGIPTPKEKTAHASARIVSVLADMMNNYTALDTKKAIVSTDRSAVENLQASLASSSAGQFLQRVAGTKEQSLRDAINNSRPLLINYIRQASEMGARGLDSEKELEFYLQAASDPKRSLQANLSALVVLDDAYGTGQLGDTVKGKLNSAALRQIQKKGKQLRNSDKSRGKIDYDRLSAQFGASQGKEVPLGLPPGSKWIGTSNGVDVYQSPDGKNYMEE